MAITRSRLQRANMRASTDAAIRRSARYGSCIPFTTSQRRSARKQRPEPRKPRSLVPMQVFVTGATGYIGFAVATALRRHGHRVFGLARSDAKAARLTRHEIEPVIGDLAEPKTYAGVAAHCSVLIHTAFDYSADGVAKNKLTIDTLLDAAGRGAQPKTLIFTSGAWVYGDTGDRMVDETTPLNPIKLVAWRPAHEQLVLRAGGVRGLVIRPGCVYGGAGGLTAPWFAKPGETVVCD